MEVLPTPLSDLLLLRPRVFADTRGHFFESYNHQQMQKNGLNFDFVQDNQSLSRKGALRGLHFQKAPHAQTKLVRVVRGAIWDVVVDLRKTSKTFGQTYGVELTGENFLQLLVPRGFAHGFLVLQDDTLVQYRCDNFYSPASESGIHYSDKTLNISWPRMDGPPTLSEKDTHLPEFDSTKEYFP